MNQFRLASPFREQCCRSDDDSCADRVQAVPARRRPEPITMLPGVALFFVLQEPWNFIRSAVWQQRTTLRACNLAELSQRRHFACSFIRERYQVVLADAAEHHAKCQHDSCNQLHYETGLHLTLLGNGGREWTNSRMAIRHIMTFI